ISFDEVSEVDTICKYCWDNVCHGCLKKSKEEDRPDPGFYACSECKKRIATNCSCVALCWCQSTVYVNSVKNSNHDMTLICNQCKMELPLDHFLLSVSMLETPLIGDSSEPPHICDTC